VCEVAEILMALSLRGLTLPAGDAAAPRTSPAPLHYDGPDQELFALLTQDPVSLDELARQTGLDLPALCGGLERLASAGVARDVGGWWERT
jgi:predicted Rossmann fold nucleotide-binding protein DprA/Smf involved in DNA uptake